MANLDILKAMLHDVINGNQAEADVKLHDYLVMKTRETMMPTADVVQVQEPDDTEE